MEITWVSCGSPAPDEQWQGKRLHDPGLRHACGPAFHSGTSAPSGSRARRLPVRRRPSSFRLRSDGSPAPPPGRLGSRSFPHARSDVRRLPGGHADASAGRSTAPLPLRTAVLNSLLQPMPPRLTSISCWTRDNLRPGFIFPLRLLDSIRHGRQAVPPFDLPSSWSDSGSQRGSCPRSRLRPAQMGSKCSLQSPCFPWVNAVWEIIKRSFPISC